MENLILLWIFLLFLSKLWKLAEKNENSSKNIENSSKNNENSSKINEKSSKIVENSSNNGKMDEIFYSECTNI